MIASSTFSKDEVLQIHNLRTTTSFRSVRHLNYLRPRILVRANPGFLASFYNECPFRFIISFAFEDANLSLMHLNNFFNQCLVVFETITPNNFSHSTCPSSSTPRRSSRLKQAFVFCDDELNNFLLTIAFAMTVQHRMHVLAFEFGEISKRE